MGADCKSAGLRLRWFESTTFHRVLASSKSAETGFASAGIAQLVERQPSKLNVAGSNPVSRSDIVACKAACEVKQGYLIMGKLFMFSPM